MNNSNTKEILNEYGQPYFVIPQNENEEIEKFNTKIQTSTYINKDLGRLCKMGENGIYAQKPGENEKLIFKFNDDKNDNVPYFYFCATNRKTNGIIIFFGYTDISTIKNFDLAKISNFKYRKENKIFDIEFLPN